MKNKSPTRVSKKERERIFSILMAEKPTFVDCDEGDSRMPNKKEPKRNWEDYPLYRVVRHKNGETSLKLIREGKY